MALKTVRNTLSLALAFAVLAGCSSTKHADNSSVGNNASNASMGSGMDATQSSSEMNNVGSEDLAGITRVYYFDYDKAQLRPDAQAALDRTIAILRKGNEHIRLEGNTDERGTREYNMALGERRAEAVANYMKINGIAPDRIETVSYGEEKPVALGHDEAAWAQNRRVELKVN